MRCMHLMHSLPPTRPHCLAAPAPTPSAPADRLKRSEASVKFKVLVTMKNVAKSGRPEFRRSLQRHREAVKACADFRGPPDPLKGNEPYRKVRAQGCRWWLAREAAARVRRWLERATLRASARLS